MGKELYNHKDYQLPKDDDGFIKSFKVPNTKDEIEEVCKFFELYGLVIFNNAIGTDDCDATVNRLFKSAESTRSFKRDYPATWHLFPTSSQGFCTDTYSNTQEAWNNRTNPNIQKCFSSVFGNDELLCSIDRFGVIRPTKDVIIGKKCHYDNKKDHDKVMKDNKDDVKDESKSTDPLSGDLVHIKDPEDEEDRNVHHLDDGNVRMDFPEFKTKSAWFHWDLNPHEWCRAIEGKKVAKDDKEEKRSEMEFENHVKTWKQCADTKKDFIRGMLTISEGNSTMMYAKKAKESKLPLLKVQGLVSLTTAYEKTGGFIAVPGFQHHISEWTKNNPEGFGDFTNLWSKEPFLKHPQKCPMRKGSLLIWDSRLPHCNYPNSDSNWRICQYIKLFPKDVAGDYLKYRNTVIKHMIKKDEIEITNDQVLYG